MSETTKNILRTASTDPVPQYYNQSTDQYEVQKGANGSSNVAVTSIAANNGVDIGDVTINNAAGANAVNIQDGGNSITVDGTVAATQSGTWNITNVSGTVSLPTGASTEATLNSVKTSVELIDDAIYTDGTGTPSKGIGIMGTDGTNPQIIKTDTNGELQVDVLTLPNITIGTALPSGGNNIGDVDVLTLPSLPSGGNIIGKMGIDQTAGQNIVYVGQMKKGAVTTAHNAIVATTTSNEIDCTGFNSLMVECDVSAITSGNWVIDVRGTFVSGGTVGDCYDLNAATPTKLTTGTMNANGKRIFLFRGIPDYVKILATRTTDGTLTCKVQPLNM